MPNFKKNAMNQVMFPMVDRTDFASIESGITASDFNSAATKKIFGVNHGVSDAFTSATISKAATLVRSGIFQQTLKAAECNYDYLIVSFRHPSCADQILIFQPAEIDPSDAYSMLSDFLSDFQSRVPKAVATNSQLSDLHSDLRSFLVVMSGVDSDAYSLLSDLQSDFQSRVPKRVATDSQLSDLHSDLRSFLVVMSGVVSDTYSLLSDVDSNFQSRVPKRVATDSQLSDVHSDLKSAIAGVTATLSVSDISDIASRVDEVLASRLSDILSAAQQGNSRVLVVQSMTSDVYSTLSDFQSDFQSRVPKRVATDSQLSDVHSDLKSAIAGVTATLSVSDISDIASRVDEVLASRLSDILSAAQQGNSRVLVVQSMTSDVYSNLSDFKSDFQSRVPKLVATNSQLSDVHSDLKSAIGNVSVTLTASDISDIASAVVANLPGVSASDISDIASAVRAILVSDLSDILSAAQQGNSRVLVVQSHASNIYSLLSDFDSNFQSRVPKLVATNSQLSDLHSDLRSFLVVMSGIGSDTYSLLSDLQSDFQSRVPKRVATDSQLSDVHSDLRSQIGGITAGVSASDISDIASAVRAIIVSDLSDILSAAQQANSRVLINQSRVSDIYSLLSDVQSDFQSRVPKRVATDSQLSDVQSDIRSLIGLGSPLTASDMSDLRSAIAAGAAATITQSDISNIASAVYAMVFGDGAVEVTLTAKDGANLLEGVDIWVTTDAAGLDIVARGYSNALGILTVYLDPGTYFCWKQLSGFTFTNPEAFTVT